MKKKSDITSDKYLVDSCLDAYGQLLQAKPFLPDQQIPVLSVKLTSGEEAMSCYLTFQTELLNRLELKGRIVVSLLYNNVIEVREAYESFPPDKYKEWLGNVLKYKS